MTGPVPTQRTPVQLHPIISCKVCFNRFYPHIRFVYFLVVWSSLTRSNEHASSKPFDQLFHTFTLSHQFCPLNLLSSPYISGHSGHTPLTLSFQINKLASPFFTDNQSFRSKFTNCITLFRMRTDICTSDITTLLLFIKSFLSFNLYFFT